MTSTQDLWEHYRESKSIWRTAEHFNLCGQTVHERLKRGGYKLYGTKYSQEEDDIIRDAYENARGSRSLNLPELAKKLGRPQHSNVSRRARELGLTDAYRKPTQEQSDAVGVRNLKRMQDGLLSRTYSNIQKGWYTAVNGERYYLKSGWETAYAQHLDTLVKGKAIQSWQYEPDTFWFEKIKRGVRSYTPDFKIVFNDGEVQYHEVKGWMDDKSKTKLKRMRIYHPKVNLIVIGKQELKLLGLI